MHLFHGIPFLRLALLLASLSLALACSRQPQPVLSDVKPKLSIEIDRGHLYALSDSEVRLYQPHLRMAATYHDGVVHLEVLNRTHRPMVVGPEYFALVRGTTSSAEPRQVIPVTSGNARALFPIATLKPGDAASGTIQFDRSLGDLTGAFLAFKHPDESILPSRCRISPKPAEMAPDTAPQTR